MMFSLHINKDVFEKLPGVIFGAVVAKGIDNSYACPDIEHMLEEATENIRRALDGVNLKEHPGILPYREAFTLLGINPNKYLSSIEALAKRAAKGVDLPRINSIVDIGNAMSLKYLLPMGAHDIDKLCGNLEVRFAEAGDRFRPFGETIQETPDINELVYVSGNTVKTRRWIWRQSDDGKIDASSRNVVFPIDGFVGLNDGAVLDAQRELSAALQKLFNCEIRTGLLNKDNNSIEL